MKTNHVCTSPKEYGPQIWGFLSLFGMSHKFDYYYWKRTLGWIYRLLDPKTNPKTGCNECWMELKAIFDESPPWDIKTSGAAARWVFDAHNRINRKKGVPEMKWKDAVKKFHWNFPLSK